MAKGKSPKKEIKKPKKLSKKAKIAVMGMV